MVKLARHIAKRAFVSAVAATAPLTWTVARRPRLVIVMYHRVLPAISSARNAEQPGMYVSPSTLDMHIRILKAHFELVHLDAWLSDATQGRALPRIACAITFDDGWRDNLTHAFPVLQKHAAPATIFLVTDLVGTRGAFWPNRLLRIIAQAAKARCDAALPHAIAWLVSDGVRRHINEGTVTPDVLDEIVSAAKRVPEQRLVEQISEAEGAGDLQDIGDAELLSWSEVQQMERGDLIRFGSHSATHHRFSSADSPERLLREIEGSRRVLLERLRSPAPLFCYPNGDVTAESMSLIRRAYAGAVTTTSGWCSASSDFALLPRIGMHDDVSSRADEFIERLANWR